MKYDNYRLSIGLFRKHRGQVDKPQGDYSTASIRCGPFCFLPSHNPEAFDMGQRLSARSHDYACFEKTFYMGESHDALNRFCCLHLKRAGAGRVRHHHNDVVVGEKPGGPFFRPLRASLSLVDDKQGDEAIFRAIQNHTRRMKTGDLFKKVRAAIADDPSSAEKLIDEATAEASRLGKRRPLKSPIRIRGTN
jgi:hypothetical protein